MSGTGKLQEESTSPLTDKLASKLLRTLNFNLLALDLAFKKAKLAMEN